MKIDLSFGVAALLLVVGTATAGSVSPRLDLLGWAGTPTNGSRSSEATAINNAGQVVGQTTVAGSRADRYQAFRYSDEVGMVQLGVPYQGFVGGINAAGVSAAGDVVAFTSHEALRYSNGSGWTYVPPLGQGFGWRMHGINEQGYAVLTGSLPNVGFTGGVQAPDGTITQVGPTESRTRTTPLAINSSNTVTGTTGDSPSGRGFVFDAAGNFTLLPVINGMVRSTGRDINDQGVVVGDLLNNQLYHAGAFTWSEAAGAQLLPSFWDGPEYPTAINNNGWIVGNTGTDTNPAREGILWLPGQAPISLTDYVHTVLGRPDVTIMTAEDINDYGQIVGQAKTGSISQAYRLTIPAAGTLAPLAAATLLSTRRRRR